MKVRRETQRERERRAIASGGKNVHFTSELEKCSNNTFPYVKSCVVPVREERETNVATKAVVKEERSRRNL
jgi:hypothetical protein